MSFSLKFKMKRLMSNRMKVAGTPANSQEKKVIFSLPIMSLISMKPMNRTLEEAPVMEPMPPMLEP